jgi:hypothetical protein
MSMIGGPPTIGVPTIVDTAPTDCPRPAGRHPEAIAMGVVGFA